MRNTDQLRLTPYQYRESNDGRILDPIDATDTTKALSIII